MGDYGVWVGVLGPQAEMGEVFGRGSSSQEGVAVGCLLCQGWGELVGGDGGTETVPVPARSPVREGPTQDRISPISFGFCAWPGLAKSLGRSLCE